MTQTIGKRIEIDGFNVQIQSANNIFVSAFLSFWLTGWTFGGIFAIRALVTEWTKNFGAALFLLFWLCGWVLGESFALATILWGFFGKEILSVNQGVLTIKRDIFGLGPRRRYDIIKITNLRATVPANSVTADQYNRPKYGLYSGAIYFDYEDKRIMIGAGLPKPEAEELAAFLKGIVR